ncbi:DUF427-domain-containing protein [Rhizodiscina lignyota]|uniref:DUF427-domain-containing protein n=1 Tax=Rhizodiscina lignyota TaxID=1504668 RepID=A0A9P4IIX6_9PEZI|nr:DUF427-domain-containing protein [Rhizodiscina lignyota]
MVNLHIFDRLKHKHTSNEGESAEPKKMHATAKVNGTVIADADHYAVVEGNIYFPPESIKKEYFTETQTHTACPWKGNASYYSLNVDGTELKDVAWFYPQPFEKATHIKDHVAFSKNKVEITSE